MSKKYISVIIFVIVALAIAVIIAALMPSATTNPATTGTSAGVESTNPNTPATAGTPTTAAKTYTRADVAKHNVQTDCWTTVNGGVYDVTTWIKQHPGGAQAIIGLCGIDGSDAFNGQHGGERRPASELASFKIGDLTK